MPQSLPPGPADKLAALWYEQARAAEARADALEREVERLRAERADVYSFHDEEKTA